MMTGGEQQHPADSELLLALEGELSRVEAGRVNEHLAACWVCRSRSQELARAITDFARVYREEPGVELPPIAGPRALLKARISEATSAGEIHRAWYTWPLAAAICLAIGIAALYPFRASFSGNTFGARRRTAVVFMPDSRLTPGATVRSGKQEVCNAANTRDKTVPAVLRRQVFAEYRIANAEPKAYEVDYLISPALGGADDIHNLWPQSYGSTTWNARVKDALEDRLRDLVCSGDVELEAAQQEIASDWIGAYKKYFQTDRPLAEHLDSRFH